MALPTAGIQKLGHEFLHLLYIQGTHAQAIRMLNYTDPAMPEATPDR